MATRAALLPSPGDPLLVGYWLRNFRQVWAEEVDELHVLLNGQTDGEALGYIARAAFADEGWRRVRLRSVPQRMDHGQAIRALLEQAWADCVVLCEDDAYVRRPGEVDARFRRIESGDCDVIGSPRGCASEELLAAAGKRWPQVPTTESGDAGHALWPCFLFARRSHLLATDRQFGARIWQAEEEVAGLGHVASATVSADTFVATSYQLRASRRVCAEAQYRVIERGLMAEWAEQAPWFHVGSLSSGYGNVFGDEEGKAPGSLPADALCSPEWERRISWWERFWRTSGEELPEHRARYREQLDRLIGEARLSRDGIAAWYEAFQPWVTWDEDEG